MKKALLIFLMMILPWQAIAATERNVTHVLGSGKSHDMEFVIKHIAEHADHVLHHHDDDADEDDDTNVDDSLKSVEHLADYDQAGSLNVLFFVPVQAADALVSPTPAVLWSDTFSDRTTIPLLRPPRTSA
ncbi:hypothetical protein [Undibacterium umbellatum]|uniref:Uncharacterized protein n=1 Tax=Undibacterium umbellatum TaxID=2762300 RepID=A0ABR6ZJU1_9BURK|nr:hypothetical protein [Undibacterium umbellatum]MBC3911522.1 hypothetical protein [Undibacterium umbellatum]